MSEIGVFEFKGKRYEFPVEVGTENEISINIKTLRGSTGGIITLDPGFKNTGSCKSEITFLDGEKGILRHRGYAIEELAKKASFLEVAYLLIFGELPTKAQLTKFEGDIKKNSLVNEEIKDILDGFPRSAHPMGVLSSLTGALTAFHPKYTDVHSEEEMYKAITKILGKFPVLAAWAHAKNEGMPFNYADNSLDYIENILMMMYKIPTEKYIPNPVVKKAMEELLILHQDHEQNCSTSTVRLVGSSHASLFASVSAGVSALWGPLHGGANQAVIEMLNEIIADGGDVDKFINRAKDKNDPFRLMGFGHRVYKNFDPRALIIKKSADAVFESLGVTDPALKVAKHLEEVALSDPYFKERKLFPNVDFYSGIIYKALGIPVEMFTVMFAIGRLPGWIAQWREMRMNNEPIGRPRQLYTGETIRDFKEMSKR
ncbi:MAG TPA: citrate synthase [Lutibacter sp.]|nr:citrate synthase [Lutibacter sp.]